MTKILRNFGLVLLFVTILGVVVGVVVFRNTFQTPDLPEIRSLEPTFPSRIETLDGQWMDGAFATKPVHLNELPAHVSQAFIAAEDHEFYSHHAFSVRGMIRAALANWRDEKITQGASTITQQLARQFVGSERTYDRKIREILLARRIEEHYTKDEILDVYLKSVFFGSNATGLTQASWRFFHKDPRELSVVEAATLAGVLPAPSVYNPHANLELARRERNRVLRRMAETGVLEPAEAERLRGTPIELAQTPAPSVHRELLASARRALSEHFGEDAWEKGGITVVVQEDLALVGRAREALHKGVLELMERQERTWEPDSGEPPVFEGAMMVADTKTGRVLASVGTAFEGSSEFDRSRQACRQPGSLFKPIVYAEAVSRGISVATMLNDLPLEMETAYGPVWNPRNADFDFRGYMMLADALAASRNIPVLRLAQHLGYESIIKRARTMGVESLIDPARSMPLGASCVRVFEMMRVYAAFQRGGLSMPYADIAYFKMPDGSVSHDYLSLGGTDHRADETLRPTQVLSPEVAFIMMNLLRRVVVRGTAYELDNAWNVAAKTGTTNQYDAWFAALDGERVYLVWIGAEKHDTPLGRRENAARVSMPVFEYFFEEFAPGTLDLSPENAPKRIEFHAIDRTSGLLSKEGSDVLPFLPRTKPYDWAPSKATRQAQSVDQLYTEF